SLGTIEAQGVLDPMDLVDRLLARASKGRLGRAVQHKLEPSRHRLTGKPDHSHGGNVALPHPSARSEKHPARSRGHTRDRGDAGLAGRIPRVYHRSMPRFVWMIALVIAANTV